MKETAREKVKPLISVIVPVYNTEAYLRQCLDSLLAQTLQDIEIIIIDDGSTDESVAICSQYADKDDRVKLFRNEHKGVAAARNEGIKSSQSAFIMFVDSDDWVEPDFCEVPYNTALETGANMVIFKIWMHGKYGRPIRQKAFPREGTVSKQSVLTNNWGQLAAAPVNKLFRRELFEGVQYPEGHLYEDSAVTYRLVYAAEIVYLMNRYLYHYRDYRPGSTTNTRTIRNITERFTYEFERVDALKEWGYEYREEEALLAVIYLANLGRHGSLSDRCNRAIRNTKHIIPTASWRAKVMFYVYRISPILFDFFSVITGQRIRKEKLKDDANGKV